MAVTGLQTLINDDAQHAFWHAATIGAKTSRRQAEQNYTTDTSVHAKMAELLSLVRKWILPAFSDKAAAPLKTSTSVTPGQMVERDSGDAPCGSGSGSGNGSGSGSGIGSNNGDEGPQKRPQALIGGPFSGPIAAP